MLNKLQMEDAIRLYRVQRQMHKLLCEISPVCENAFSQVDEVRNISVFCVRNTNKPITYTVTKHVI